MKKPAFKSSIAALLVIGLVLPMFAIFAPTAFAYAEDSDWKNTNSKAPTDYAYSLAVVGDTQSMVKKDLTNGTNYMSSIYSWLAANVESKKIQYVLGVGDITEYEENFNDEFDGSWTYDDEWTHAKNAITLLDNKVPYSLCRGGGHDTVKKFNEYFGTHAYFTGNIDGTYEPGNYTSAYYTFEVGSVKYLILTLDWNPTDAILNWASGVVEAHADRRVILTTHAYLAADGTLHGSSTSHSALQPNNNGIDIYEKLVSKHSNIQLVISGHNSSSNVVKRQDVREDGSVVTSLLVDPQTFDSQNNGETGMVCMLYFTEDGNTVDVEWYSTVRNQYYKESNQFTLKLNEIFADDGSILTKYGTIPADYVNANEYPFVSFKRTNDGEWTFIKAYKTLYADSNLGLTANADIAIHSLYANNEATRTGEERVILMRSNFTNKATASYSNAGYFVHNATIDLGGFTLTNNSNTIVFRAEGKGAATNDVAYNVINGNVVLNQKALFEFADVPSGTKSINVTIDGLNVSFAEGSTITNVFNYSDGARAGEFSVTVKNSTFDLVTNAPEGAQLLPVKAYDAAHLVFNIQDTTKIETLETPYGTIPYKYADKEKYPFIAFVGNEVIASANIFFDESGCLERTLRSKNTGDGAVIILRRDFTLPKQGFLYTNYQKGDFVIDLMGHTVTNPFGENLFSSNGTQTHETTTIVKNGTLVLAKSLLSVSTHNNAPGKTQNFTFENLNITSTYNHLAFHNTSASSGNVNINYVDCNFTFTNNNANIFSAGKSATDTNIVTHITVKGGSVKINTFDQSRFVAEYNGGTVKFLADDNGEYTKVYAKEIKNNAIDNEYKTDNGDRTLVKLGTSGGYNVYYLRVADKLVYPQVSLTMHTSFIYNVYLPIAAKDFITSITIGEVVYDVNALPTKVLEDGNEYLHIEKEINANEAGKNFKLTISSDVQSQVWAVGVVAYAELIMNGNYNTTEKTLAKDILAYVRAVYAYEKNENTAKVVAKINDLIGENYEVEPTVTEKKQSVDGLLGAGLILGNRPAYYFIPEYDTDLYTFHVNGAEVTTEVGVVNGKTAIIVYTYAYAVTETVSYSIEGTDITGEYNLAAYLEFAEGVADGENLVNLVKALWQYSDTAKAYRSQVNG